MYEYDMCIIFNQVLFISELIKYLTESIPIFRFLKNFKEYIFISEYENKKQNKFIYYKNNLYGSYFITGVIDFDMTYLKVIGIHLRQFIL